MKTKITISLNNDVPQEVSQFYQTYVVERYLPMLEMLKSKELWSDQIDQIVFCQDVEIYLESYNSKNKTNHKLTREREHYGVSKNLYTNNSQITILLPLPIPDPNQSKNVLIIDKLFLNQILLIKSDDFLPKEFDGFQKGLKLVDTNDLNSIIKYLFSEWFSIDFTNSIINELDPEDQSLLMSHENGLTVFKRKLKRILYDSNSDDEFLGSNWSHVLNQYINIFGDLINRILENSPTNLSNDLKLKQGDESEILYNLITEIRKNKTAVLNGEKTDLNKIKYLFQDFARIFNIHILQNDTEEEKRIGFHIYTNPKKLFKEDLIETETKFVAFIDILGFSQMIKEYDQNPLSTLLQDIQKALDEALKDTVGKLGNEIDDSFLEYKLFSDNLCVSIPFFENKQDYSASFSAVLGLVKVYQHNLMKKGYFVRGAISIGSYYSDENMIFSDGLVKAYHLETHKAIYPRIMIDGEIIKKLKELFPTTLPSNLTHEIIESPNENIYFVNPFINVPKAMSSFKEMIAETILTTDMNDLEEKQKIEFEKGKSAFKDFLDLMYDKYSEVNSDNEQIRQITDIIKTKISLLPNNKKPNILEKIKTIMKNKKKQVSPRDKLNWLQEFCDWYLEKEKSNRYKTLI